MNIEDQNKSVDVFSNYIPVNKSEKFFYNESLKDSIDKINDLKKSSVDPLFHQKADTVLLRLTHQINKNEHYAALQKKNNPQFSVYFCTVSRDYQGLQYLLRVGENPNLMVSGKTALHVAAARGMDDYVKLLLQSPQIDVSQCTRKGKTAADLSANQRIRNLFKAHM
jgi:ankyrin repeat protein